MKLAKHKERAEALYDLAPTRTTHAEALKWLFLAVSFLLARYFEDE